MAALFLFGLAWLNYLRLDGLEVPHLLSMGKKKKVVPDGAVNFAFLGQFAETARDTIFTTELGLAVDGPAEEP